MILLRRFNFAYLLNKSRNSIFEINVKIVQYNNMASLKEQVEIKVYFKAEKTFEEICQYN